MKVYLSPSLQEKNIGVGKYGTEEYRMNQVTDIIEPILKNNGIEVFRNIPNMTLAQAIADSNSHNVDLHFAIHSNASGIGTVKGTSMYVYSKSVQAMKFANLVYTALSTITPWSDRGIMAEPNFYELNSTKALAGLVEVDFHDNIQSEEWIVNNIQSIGEKLAKCVLDYFGIKEKVVEPIIIEETPSTTPNDWGQFYISQLLELGIISQTHESTEVVTFGAMAKVVMGIYEKLKK